MRIDVAFTPAGLPGAEVAGRTVFVIDVLRASTTICAALAHGVRGIVPVGSIEEAMRLAQTLERREVLLAGERNATHVRNFDPGAQHPGHDIAPHRPRLRGLLHCRRVVERRERS